MKYRRNLRFMPQFSEEFDFVSERKNLCLQYAVANRSFWLISALVHFPLSVFLDFSPICTCQLTDLGSLQVWQPVDLGGCRPVQPVDLSGCRPCAAYTHP